METSEGNEGMFESKSLPENYCIIEGRNSVVDFADMQVEEIAMNIESRRQRVFLLMEELRRLRVQQRVKTIGSEDADVEPKREFESVIPGFPVLTEDSVQDYRIYWGCRRGDFVALRRTHRARGGGEARSRGNFVRGVHR